MNKKYAIVKQLLSVKLKSYLMPSTK